MAKLSEELDFSGMFYLILWKLLVEWSTFGSHHVPEIVLLDLVMLSLNVKVCGGVEQHESIAPASLRLDTLPLAIK